MNRVGGRELGNHTVGAAEGLWACRGASIAIEPYPGMCTNTGNTLLAAIKNGLSLLDIVYSRFHPTCRHPCTLAARWALSNGHAGRAGMLQRSNMLFYTRVGLRHVHVLQKLNAVHCMQRASQPVDQPFTRLHARGETWYQIDHYACLRCL